MLERDRIIVELRAHIVTLQKRLEAPIHVDVKLPEDFAVQMPALLRRRAKPDAKTEDSPKPKQEIEWADANENDLPQLAKLAAEELGTTRVSPLILQQTIARIKRRILMAKTNRAIKQMELGVIDSRVSPSARTSEAVDIPEEIRQRIEEAERV